MEHLGGMCWMTKIEEKYATMVGQERGLMFLEKYQITEQISSSHNVINIGFSPMSQKWYGWSHRAIYGFGVGHKMKIGDVGFQPSCRDEFIYQTVNFWQDEYTTPLKAEVKDNNLILTGVYLETVPNKDLVGTKYEHTESIPEKWGRGVWTAKNLQDAKQMAIDFAEDVG